MPSIRSNRALDRRLRAVAAAQDGSGSRGAREAIAAFVAAAEDGAPRGFSHHERLSVTLQANWLAYPKFIAAVCRRSSFSR